MKRFLLGLLMLFSVSAFGDYLKGVYPPEVTERDENGNCSFGGPAILDLKIPAETTVLVMLEDANGITFPMGWSWISLDKFRGVWGFEFPGIAANGQEWFLYAYITPPDQHWEVITPADRVIAVSCPLYIP